MCGIVACLINTNSGVRLKNRLLSGLTQLQNRGYDSAGISILFDSKILTTKFASESRKTAIEKLTEHIDASLDTRVGIAHTRWATHGEKSDNNSHPHHSNDHSISIVHNGIIENYLELKQFLFFSGYIFHSQTDSEVIANLISFYYNKGSDIEKAIAKTIRRLEGTYGIAILCEDTPDKFYCVANGSPLLVGKNDDSIMVASEMSGFCNQFKTYITLKHDDILTVYIDDSGSPCYKTNSLYETSDVVSEEYDLTPEPYEYWTLKEIYEQPNVIQKSMNLGGRILSKNEVKLGGLDKHAELLRTVDHLILIGCGTSEHAGMYASHIFKTICDFTTVQTINGAEFSIEDLPKKGIAGIIFISQSGETKDVYRCVEMIRDLNIVTMGVINVVDSLIAREVNCGVYCNAGREVAVASTKSFTSQVICLHLIAVWFSALHGVSNHQRCQVIADLKQLHDHFENTLTALDSLMEILAKEFVEKDSFFILGKGTDEPIAKEGALKIKEISYIHAEGHSATALKHGPFALLSPDMPVILIDNIHYSNKIRNTLAEIASRNSPIYFISASPYEESGKNESPSGKNESPPGKNESPPGKNESPPGKNESPTDKINSWIRVEKNDTFQSLLNNIPLQLLAYHISILKGINPDTPKNLAKVVTVE